MELFSGNKGIKNYCIFCGKDLANGVCTACGREAKPMISFHELEYHKVPVEAAEALGEQKKKLFGNSLYTVKEMIKNGDLYIADIHIDEVFEEEYESSIDSDSSTVCTYYVQISRPDLAPCDRCCESSTGQYMKIKQLLQNGQQEGKLLWGKWKKKNYYYVFVPQSDNWYKSLKTGLAEKLIDHGDETEKRRIPPKGGFGNSTADKVFDAVWDNTVGKL